MKKMTRACCQPRKLPIAAIRVTSPKPMASCFSTQWPAIRTSQIIPPPKTRPTMLTARPCRWGESSIHAGTRGASRRNTIQAGMLREPTVTVSKSVWTLSGTWNQTGSM